MATSADDIVAGNNDNDDDDGSEAFTMLLLADSNLPTGSFVASAGLESYIKHGFFSAAAANAKAPTRTSANANEATMQFLRASLSTYAHSALPFVADAHDAASSAIAALRCHMRDTDVVPTLSSSASASASVSVSSAPEDTDANASPLARTTRRLTALDALYHASTLNDATRRASAAQGIALLALYSRGFSAPLLVSSLPSSSSPSTTPARGDPIVSFIDALKLRTRRGEMHGHLPVCWGVLTAALGLRRDRSQHLHLFLQARSLLSASVRLNTIGPYAAQQLLVHAVRPLVVELMHTCAHLRTHLVETGCGDGEEGEGDGEIADEHYDHCAATTWPLGEILAARHDLLHSRIFNS